MEDFTTAFVITSRKTLDDWLGRIEKCLGQLTAEQIWWRGQKNSNAIGNIVLHLSGNVRQWIISGVGGAKDIRDRDSEFAQRDALPASQLLELLRDTMSEADEVLARVKPQDLLQVRHIQVYDVTLMEAIYGVVTHFALHAGQILYATKLMTGKDLGFYKYLQKPRD